MGSILRFADYKHYLDSPEWKARSAVIKSFAEYRCQLCGRTLPASLLDVHHNNYDRRGRERQTDLICLCRVGCHILFEFNKKHGEQFRADVQAIAAEHGRADATLADVAEWERGLVAAAREHLAIAREIIDMARSACCYSREWRDGMREGRAA